MEQLSGVTGLTIRQKGTLGEAVTGWERKNYYDVQAPSGEQLFSAEEVGADYTLGKEMFEEHRTFQINVKEIGGGIALRCIRAGGVGEVLEKLRSGKMPYRSMHVYDGRNNEFGTITRKFSLLRTNYQITAPSGRVISDVIGWPFIPFSFDVRVRGRSVATVKKNFRNILLEMWTKADSYDVEYGAGCDDTHKALLLALVFLVDFNVFESSGK